MRVANLAFPRLERAVASQFEAADLRDVVRIEWKQQHAVQVPFVLLLADRKPAFVEGRHIRAQPRGVRMQRIHRGLLRGAQVRPRCRVRAARQFVKARRVERVAIVDVFHRRLRELPNRVGEIGFAVGEYARTRAHSSDGVARADLGARKRFLDQ